MWTEFLTAVRTNQAQAARALGAPVFDYYADHPDEAAIFRATTALAGLGIQHNIGRLDVLVDNTASMQPIDCGREANSQM